MKELKEKIVELENLIESRQKEIDETVKELEKLRNDIPDYKGKYLKFNSVFGEGYMYVKNQSKNKEILQGPCLTIYRTLKNVRYTYSYSLNNEYSALDKFVEITKDEFLKNFEYLDKSISTLIQIHKNDASEESI